MRLKCIINTATQMARRKRRIDDHLKGLPNIVKSKVNNKNCYDI